MSYTVETVSTRGLPPLERADFWNEHVRGYHGPLDFSFASPDGFRGGTVRQRTARYQLVDFWSEAVDYRRTPRQASRDPDDAYRLLVPMAGRLTVRADGAEASLSPGSGSVLPPSRPFELRQDRAARACILSVPASAAWGPLPAAVRLDLSSGLGRVVHGMVTSLAREGAVLTASQFDGICERAVELLCLLTAPEPRRAPGSLAEVEDLVRRHVREHAADPSLTVSSLSHALGWSVRQIQLALQHAGTTPRDLIREERLRLVHRRLLDPAHRHRTITDLAHASGFPSAGALSAAFRRHYGLSPRELRRLDAGDRRGLPHVS